MILKFNFFYISLTKSNDNWTTIEFEYSFWKNEDYVIFMKKQRK